MEQQLIEKAQGHQLLFFSHICGVLTQNRYIGSQALPMLFTSCGLKKTAEFFFVVEFIHQPYVVIDGTVFIFTCNLIGMGKSCILLRCRFGRRRLFFRYLRQTCVHAQSNHIVLKIFQLVVYPAVTLFLCLVHIVQFIQNNIKGIIKCIKVYYFFSF